MKTKAVFGIDIGTSSSKAVLTSLDGLILRSASRQHSVLVPEPGMAEMDARLWWDELTGMARELLGLPPRPARAHGVCSCFPTLPVNGHR